MNSRPPEASWTECPSSESTWRHISRKIGSSSTTHISLGTRRCRVFRSSTTAAPTFAVGSRTSTRVAVPGSAATTTVPSKRPTMPYTLESFIAMRPCTVRAPAAAAMSAWLTGIPPLSITSSRRHSCFPPSPWIPTLVVFTDNTPPPGMLSMALVRRLKMI